MDKTKIEKRNRAVFSLINLFGYINKQTIESNKKDLSLEFYSLFIYYLENFAGNNSLYQLLQKNGIISYSKITQEEAKSYLYPIKKHFLFGNKTDYRYLLLLEIIYSLETFGIPITDDFCNSLIFQVGFKKSKVLTILSQLKNIDLIKDKRVITSLTSFNEYKALQNNYDKLKVYNIAVCATMSAGKSSFVNALLGYDYLPARNEATTARITSVYDNDNLKNLIGFTLSNNSINQINDNLKQSDIETWNNTESIEQIVLQGDLDSIGNNGAIVTVHDTPGTNNSGDDSHHNITFGFLHNNKLDAIIFVANAEHLCTTDEKQLLVEIYDKKIKKENIPILFVLNKADCIDREKEDINEIITDYTQYLLDIGFTNPKIFPVSSKAARLLKMAIKNSGEQFSSRELREFQLCFDEFLEDYDFSQKVKPQNISDKIIKVGKNDYSIKKISEAVSRTGISAIEKGIESLF